MHKAIDLFAGCGGLTLGFQNSGFTVVAAFDNWKPAIDIYRKNFPGHPIHEVDLGSSTIDRDVFRRFKPDLIIGGPPCQDFSSAGKRDESLGRANLTISFAHIVTSVFPEFFVMENVERIHASRALREAVRLFRSNHYGLTWRTLDASLCGVPQKRKRFFLIGHQGAKDEFLGTYLDSSLATKPMTIRDYLGDSIGIEHFYRHPRSYERRGIFSIDEPSPTIRGVNRRIPETYEFHPGDSTKRFRHVRPLTTIERSYIQTFPKGFIFEGSKSDLEQMIGNAVPVKLAEYVALALRSYMRQKARLRKGPVLFMPDQFTRRKRSEIMRAVRSAGNVTTEFHLIQLLKSQCITGWRRNYPLFGRPDIVFPKPRVAVFADGCFWHGHNCRNVSPKRNAEYWHRKVTRNKRRDTLVRRTLRKKRLEGCSFVGVSDYTWSNHKTVTSVG